MLLVWLQVFSLGLTSGEARQWRSWAKDTARWDSILRGWGYWGAQPDSGILGPKYYLHTLRWRGDTAKLVPDRFARQWEGKPLTPVLLRDIPLSLQRRFLDAGFLFCTVAWHDLTCDAQGRCTALLEIVPGEKVRLDTILLRGKWLAPRSAFYQITGLRPGQPLRLTQLENLSRRVRNSPYATVVDTPRLWLFPGLAWLEIDLKPKTGNRIDGALSLLPSTGTNRAQVIGHLELALLSPLRMGEKIEARFAQLPGGSQRLHLLFAFPYLLRGYVEAQGRFSLWRQDTSFLTREASAEVRYRLTPTLSIIGGIHATTSRLINTQPFKDRVWPPPPVLDFQRRGLRLGWQYEQVDIRLAPRRGWIVSLLGTQGRRGYIRNPGLSKLAYERLPAVGTFQELAGAVHRYTPIGNVLSLHIGALGYRYLSQGAFENELPRAGGAPSLRGFAENTFPTAGYLHGIGELRLHIEEESYIGTFTEMTQIDLYGRGETLLQAFGLVLQTRLAAGLLQMTLAAGRQRGAPWDWRRALVRLEWLSEF